MRSRRGMHLKACPHCGDDPVFETTAMDGKTVCIDVVCRSCNLETTGRYDTRREAADAWNGECGLGFGRYYYVPFEPEFDRDPRTRRI